jgi:signal peptidase II
MNKWFLSLFFALTTVDMGTKQYIEDTWKKGEERDTILPGIVCRKVYNKGFFLNFMDKNPKVVKGATAGVTAIIALMDYLIFQERGRWLEKLAMVFISAGAFSNTFDRLVRGKVIDYFGIKCKVKKIRRLTANLADVYVLLGSILLFILNIKKK